MMKSKDLARGAFAISLILVSFTMFRGILNLINSITVPILILFFTQKFSRQAIFSFSIAILLAIFFLFPYQIMFMLLDMGIAYLLKFLYNGTFLHKLLYSIIVTVLLILSVVLTDQLFQTNINTLMLKISNSNPFKYVLIFLVESMIISGAHFFFYRMIVQRANNQ